MATPPPTGSTVLYCTVGGSHQPIVTAIRSRKPDRVVFVCSMDDSATGAKGSHVAIQGAGSVCKSRNDARPDLPNIPTQTDLDATRYEILLVPADEPVAAIEALVPRLEREVRSGAHVVADYTGGTKSMSTALFHAAALTAGVEIAIVTGPRSDLIRVLNGVERVRRLTATARLEARWRIREAARAWRRYAYAEAAEVLQAIEDPTGPCEAARLLSLGFAAWDAGAYGHAKEVTQTVGRTAGSEHLRAIAHLARDPGHDDEGTTAHRIWDLVLAAERHAQTHRHDTAILLRYRAFEWIAQWSLRWHHQIDCANAPLEGELAEGPLKGLVHAGHDRRGKIGAYNAWQALGRLGGPLQGIAAERGKEFLSFAEKRNASRLAHGAQPVSASEDEQHATWFAQHIQPAFLACAFRGRPPFPQLPSDLNALLGAEGPVSTSSAIAHVKASPV